MKLSICKFFDFSAAHRLFRTDWSAEKNLAFFGKESLGVYGHGHNYRVGLGFRGPIDPATGMICELSKLKAKILVDVMPRFDHVFLNQQSVFLDTLPTVEVVSSAFYEAVQAHFSEDLSVDFCHLSEAPSGEASLSLESGLESHFTFQILQVPQTILRQGKALEVIHPVIVRVSFDYMIDPLCHHYQAELLMKSRFIQWANEFRSPEPLTLETYATMWWPLLQALGPVKRIKLLGLGGQSCTFRGEDYIDSSYHTTHHWGHQLKSSELNHDENKALFGRCFQHHGHSFEIDTTIRTPVSELQGQLIVGEIARTVELVTTPWNYTSITDEILAFQFQPGTCELVIQELASQLQARLPLCRLSMFETPNNQFILECP